MNRWLRCAWIAVLVLASQAALAQVPLSDSPSRGAAPRVVALSWEMVEHLLKLGITPVAVADAEDYRRWVVRPELPAAVPNAGTRAEPNLELLAQLHPDLILMTPLLDDLRDTLQRIAPVQVYGDFSQQQDNLALQRRNFLALAKQLGRVPRAQLELQEMDARIADMRQRIDRHFAGHPPKVTVLLFSSPASVLVMGPNSMPDHALQLLGLHAAMAVPVSRWGSVQVPVTALGSVQEGVLLYIEPFAQVKRLFDTALWQSMPLARQGHVIGMASSWTQGGIFSVEQLATAIGTALLSMPAQRPPPVRASLPARR